MSSATATPTPAPAFPSPDGPTAVAYLAQHLSIPFTYYGDPDFKDQGLNFSVSGAKTGSVPSRPNAAGKTIARGMKEQVDQFVALLKAGQIKFDPAQTMFFFAGGLNDRNSPDGYTRTNEEDEIDTLYALGARRFLVALLPTQIPVFATAGTQFNPELARIPAEEQAKHPDIRIANSDWGPFFDQVITHPDQYGITNTTTPLLRTRKARRKGGCLRHTVRLLLLLRSPPIHRRPQGRWRHALQGKPRAHTII